MTAPDPEEITANLNEGDKLFLLNLQSRKLYLDGPWELLKFSRLGLVDLHPISGFPGGYSISPLGRAIADTLRS